MGGGGEVKLPYTNISFRGGKAIPLDFSLIVDTFKPYEPLTLQVQLTCKSAPTIIEKQIPNLNDLHTLPYSWIRGLFLTVIFFCIFFVLIKICQL